MCAHLRGTGRLATPFMIFPLSLLVVDFLFCSPTDTKQAQLSKSFCESGLGKHAARLDPSLLISKLGLTSSSRHPAPARHPPLARHRTPTLYPAIQLPPFSFCLLLSSAYPPSTCCPLSLCLRFSFSSRLMMLVEVV